MFATHGARLASGAGVSSDPDSIPANDTSIEALRHAFETISGRTITSLSSDEAEQLRVAVYAAVGDLRRVAMLPDRVIAIVQLIARDAGVHVAENNPLDPVVNWCVQAYRGDPA